MQLSPPAVSDTVRFCPCMHQPPVIDNSAIKKRHRKKLKGTKPGYTSLAEAYAAESHFIRQYCQYGLIQAAAAKACLWQQHILLYHAKIHICCFPNQFSSMPLPSAPKGRFCRRTNQTAAAFENAVSAHGRGSASTSLYQQLCLPLSQTAVRTEQYAFPARPKSISAAASICPSRRCAGHHCLHAASCCGSILAEDYTAKGWIRSRIQPLSTYPFGQGILYFISCRKSGRRHRRGREQYTRAHSAYHPAPLRKCARPDDPY